jgi:hypothetical protein
MPLTQQEREAANAVEVTHHEVDSVEAEQRKTADAIARGEDPPWNGLYAPFVPNPPTKKGTKKDKPSSSYHKDG